MWDIVQMSFEFPLSFYEMGPTLQRYQHQQDSEQFNIF